MIKTVFNTFYNDSGSGAFKDAKPIAASDTRSLVTDLSSNTLIWPEDQLLNIAASFGSNDYAVTFPITVSAYTDIPLFYVKPNQTNTDSVTLTTSLGTNALGAYAPDGSLRNLYIDEFKANRIYGIGWNGSQYILLGDYGGSFKTQYTLNTARILTGFSSPVQLTNIPGAGNMIRITSPLVCKYKYGSAAFATNTNFKIYYGTSTAITSSISGLLNQTSDKISIISSLSVQDSASNIENQAIYLIVDTGNPTSGTGSSLVVEFDYEILTL